MLYAPVHLLLLSFERACLVGTGPRSALSISGRVDCNNRCLGIGVGFILPEIPRFVRVGSQIVEFPWILYQRSSASANVCCGSCVPRGCGPNGVSVL